MAERHVVLVGLMGVGKSTVGRRLAREIDGYDQLVAAGLMTLQQAKDSLQASPRAYATLRSDYETPAVAPAGGPSLMPWDGVTRLSPREE